MAHRPCQRIEGGASVRFSPESLEPADRVLTLRNWLRCGASSVSLQT